MLSLDKSFTLESLIQNDAKISLPERKKRLDLKVGNYLDKLYVKEINAARNRISVTIKTIQEDLEERVVSGKDTIEDQMGYPNTPLYNESLQNFANYVEFLKLSGLFDGFLREIGGTRDSSLKYLAYLTNIHNQKLLRDDQMSLYVERFTPKRVNGKPDPKYAYRKINIKTKKGRNEFKDKFNSLADDILKLDSSLIHPDKKSIYNVGEASVWNNDVTTPITELTKNHCFINLNEQIKHALNVVQGNAVDKVDLNQLSNQSLVDSFKALKEIFDTNLSNSVNTDDVIDRDRITLAEDIVSLGVKYNMGNSRENSNSRESNSLDKSFTREGSSHVKGISREGNSRESISREKIDPVKEVLNEVAGSGANGQGESGYSSGSSGEIPSRVLPSREKPLTLNPSPDIFSSDNSSHNESKSGIDGDKTKLDLKSLIDLSNNLDGIKPQELLKLIESMEGECADDPELSIGLAELKNLARNAMQGNLTAPLESGESGNKFDEMAQQLLSDVIAYDAKRKSMAKVKLETAKKTLIPPDPTKYIPKGSEIEGCWYILKDLLKITRFRRMLDRFNISVDQHPEKLIRDIANIVPKLIVKRIDVDRKLSFNYTEDHMEEIPKIPI